ncbi:MAG: hypothetical protein R2844_02475 [Caldilineales bacterium]
MRRAPELASMNYFQFDELLRMQESRRWNRDIKANARVSENLADGMSSVETSQQTLLLDANDLSRLAQIGKADLLPAELPTDAHFHGHLPRA